MKEFDQQLSGIDFKIRQLIDKYQSLQRKNLELINQVQELTTTSAEQKETIKQLEEKVNILKLAKTLETKEGNIEAKVKINELVREIDKCIGMLNT
jgi:uncharacterized coiled-coil DUF342 family protein